MSFVRAADPVTPTVTFDSYVIPGTVRKRRRRQAALISPAIATAGTIGGLTFLLGILSTLQFIGPRSEAVATLVDPKPVSADLDQVVAASLGQGVTRARHVAILTPPEDGGTRTAMIEALQVDILQGLTPLRTVGKLTQEEKNQSVQQALSIASRNKLRMLREGVLADVYTVESQIKDGHKRIVLKTINAELTRKSMANLLGQAASEGRIVIPASLNTIDGEVDMDTLIFNLVQTSLAEDGTPEGAKAARELDRRAFAAPEAQTKQVKGDRFYVVQAGDSLAYISLQFYGRPKEYERIFWANRPLLSSPDKIQTGQRLKIPS